MRVEVYDEATGNLISTEFTDAAGSYYFSSLPPATYSIIACITIEENGVQNDYSAYVTGVVISSGTLSQQNLFLELDPAGCS